MGDWFGAVMFIPKVRYDRSILIEAVLPLTAIVMGTSKRVFLANTGVSAKPSLSEVLGVALGRIEHECAYCSAMRVMRLDINTLTCRAYAVNRCFAQFQFDSRGNNSDMTIIIARKLQML